VVNTLINAALAGDVKAADALLARVLPRTRNVMFDLPPINDAADGALALSAILAACGAGKLTPDEAKVLSDIVHKKVETSHMAAVERRLGELEAAASGKALTYRRVD
jgi:hypothetical protein